MQGDLTECRIQASRCTEWAAETNDPILSKKFADLAGQWTKMADDIEGLTGFNATARDAGYPWDPGAHGDPRRHALAWAWDP